MAEFLTTTKIKEILGQVPEQNRNEVLQGLIQQGHEIEGLNQQFSPGKAVSNIPGSAVQVAKDIGTAVSSPIDTLQGLGQAVVGGVSKLLPKGGKDSLQLITGGITGTLGKPGKSEKTFEAVAGAFAERYGSIDRAQETLERDPVGFLGDVTAIFSGGAGLVKAVSTGTRFAKIAKAAGDVGKVAKFADPTNLAFQLAKTPIKATARGIAAKTNILKLTRSQAKRLKQIYGKDANEVVA